MTDEWLYVVPVAVAVNASSIDQARRLVGDALVRASDSEAMGFTITGVPEAIDV